MKKFPLVISFYTENTPYQVEAERLIASCKKFSLRSIIEGVPSFGSWELNCAYKPFFIHEKLLQVKEPVLWVDADGVFLKRPEFIEAFEADLAVRIESEVDKDHPSKVISSTIFVDYNPKAIELIKSWGRLSAETLLDPQRKWEFWDQISLRDAIYLNPSALEVVSMPLSYAKIFDHPDDVSKSIDAVIEHYQASRILKKMI